MTFWLWILAFSWMSLSFSTVRCSALVCFCCIHSESSPLGLSPGTTCALSQVGPCCCEFSLFLGYWSIEQSCWLRRPRASCPGSELPSHLERAPWMTCAPGSAQP